MFWRFAGYSPVGRDEAISGLELDIKPLENRKPHQHHNQSRVQPRRSRPSNVSEPFHSKASVSRGEDRELDINETISRLRHMRKRIHRATAVNATTITTATHHHQHQPSQPSFGFAADIYNLDDMVSGRNPLITPLRSKLKPSPSPPPDIPTTQLSLSPSFIDGRDKSNRHKIHPTSGDAVLVAYLDNNRDPEIAHAAGLKSLPCDEDLLSPESRSQMAQWEYNARGEFGDLNEVFDLAMTNTNHKTTNERTCDQEALNKTPGTHKVAARDDVDAADYDWSAYLSRYQSPNSQSSKGHVQRQARHGFTRTSTRKAETSHTEFKPIDNKIHSTLDMPTLTGYFPRPSEGIRMVLNDGQSADNAQKNDSAVTQDERLTDTSLKLDPTLHTADHDSFVDQPHDMPGALNIRDDHHDHHLEHRAFGDCDLCWNLYTTPFYTSTLDSQPETSILVQHDRGRPRRRRTCSDPFKQTQASNAPTGHPISFHHLSSTHLRQRYQASLSNISAVQNYRRRGVQMGIRKEKAFEELPNPFSASGHYTISQDHTAGEETRRSHLLANFGRRCGANTDERERLKLADDELNPPAIDMESVSTFARQDDLKPPDTGLH